MRSATGMVLLVGLLTSGVPARGTPADVVHLIPEDRASWRARNLFAWTRPGHFYGERRLEIDTTPPGATIDLFYVRSNFQKLYEQAEAPVTVILPKRAEAGPRDAVTIRAFLPGYRQRETSVRVDSRQEKILLELDPLPNVLRTLAHTYFAGRASLAFLTKELATVRVQERDEGVHVILTETGMDPELGSALSRLHSPLVEGVEALQLGEDLLVRVELAAAAREEAFDLRSRRSHDPLRNLHSFSLDLVPADGGVAAVERARAALAGITPRDVEGCATRFDETLRASLEPAALARALAPRGSFTDPYLRAAMKRLGEISSGSVTLVDGAKLRTSAPLELAAAMNQASQVTGYLVMLRSFVHELEPAYADEVLRSLIAPELDPTRYQEILGKAQAEERACRVATPS